MKRNKHLTAFLLALTMLVSSLPLPAAAQSNESSLPAGTNAGSQSAITRLVDGSTGNTWGDHLGGDGNTLYNGRIWADKSVSTENVTFGESSVEIGDSDFLVTLSALATSTSVVHKQPTDTVFILDFSGSMNWKTDGEEVLRRPQGMSDADYYKDAKEASRLWALVNSMNSSIHALATHNPDNRIGIVVFNGTAQVVQELTTVKKRSDMKYLEITSFTLDPPPTSSDGKQEADATVTFYINDEEKKVETAGGTNIQAGLYLGMKMLAEENNTTINVEGGEKVTRIPSVIFMGDGAPTTFSSAKNAKYNNTTGEITSSIAVDKNPVSSGSWWDNLGTAAIGRGDINNPDDADGLMPLLTAQYWKEQIQNKYYPNKDGQARMYNIGFSTEHQTEGMVQMANLVLNPADNWIPNPSGSDKNDAVKSVCTLWGELAKNKSAAASAPLGNAESDEKVTYNIDMPQNWVLPERPNYVDEYYTANSTDGLNEVFTQIINKITDKAQVPTQVGGAPDKSGYITFTDPLGQFMVVDDIEAILFANELFAEKSLQTEDSVTTYHFEGHIDSPIYGSNQELTDIIIKVSKNEAMNQQTVTVEIPASIIPVRVDNVSLNSDGSVENIKTTEAMPIRIFYGVSLGSDYVDTAGNLTPAFSNSEAGQTYIQNHTDQDGNVCFYSNEYTGQRSGAISYGDTTVTFTPDTGNPYYFIQEDTPLYRDEKCTVRATKSDTTYYFKQRYYSTKEVEGDKFISKFIYERLIERPADHFAEANLGQEPDGELYIKVGSPRLGYLRDMEEDKADNNVTGTADKATYPQYTSITPGSQGTIYLGNNGLLKTKVPGHLSITKELVSPVTADAQLNFKVKIQLTQQPTADSSVSEGTAAVPVDFNATIQASVTNGTENTRSVQFTGGEATATLKAGETITLTGLPAGVQYTVTEVDGDNNAYLTSQFQVLYKHAAAASGQPDTETTDPATGTIPAMTEELATDQGKVEITNAKGSLTISKTVSDGGDKSKDFTFDLTLNGITGQTSYPVSWKRAEGHQVDSDSNSNLFFNDGKPTQTITLRHGESVTISGIPAGTTYSVKETAADGYTAQYPGGSNGSLTDVGADGITGTIPAGSTAATAAFTNVYSVQVPLTVTKVIDGRSWKTSDIFKFYLYKAKLENGSFVKDGNTVIGNATVDFDSPDVTFGDPDATGKKAEFEDINELKFTTAGTYYFLIEEEIPSEATDNKLNGVVYCEDPVPVTVTVQENAETGILESTVTYGTTATETNGSTSACITNKYEPSGNATVEVIKTFTGREWGKDEFTFNLYRVPYTESDIPTLDQILSACADKENLVATATVDNNSRTIKAQEEGTSKTVSFQSDALSFSSTGTHFFAIKEVIPKNADTNHKYNGITYDGKTVLVKVEVSDPNGNGSLTTDVTYDGEANTPVFTNQYEASPAQADLSVTKSISGREEWKDTDNFTFKLYSVKAQGNEPTTEEMDAAVQGMPLASVVIGSNTPDKTAAFASQTITTPGTHYYVIKEEGTENSGNLTYDTHLELVKVTVSENTQTGALEVSSVTYGDGSNTAASFTNIHTPSSIQVPLAVTKVIDGREWKDTDRFTFNLYKAKEATSGSGYEKDGDPISDVTVTYNSSDVTFGNPSVSGKKAEFTVTTQDLTFAEAGTRYFLIQEEIPETAVENGITYSSEAVGVTVKVSQNTAGELVPTVTYTVATDANNTSALITNTYAFTQGSLKLTASKSITGDRTNLLIDEFTFLAQEADQYGNLVENGRSARGTNDAAGNITFDPLLFPNPGTFYFLITEKKGTENQITYDQTAYLLKVEAKDQDNGPLSVNVVEKKQKKAGETEWSVITDGVTFSNTFTWADVEVTIPVAKFLTGRDLKANEFSLTVTPDENNPDGASLTESTNYSFDENGSASIVLRFTKSDTFVYEVAETQGNLGGVTYDGSKYTVTIEIGKNAEGTGLARKSLTIQKTHDSDGAEMGAPTAEESITFINTYTTGKVTIQVPVKKITEVKDGGVLPSDISFSISAMDDDNQGDVVTIVGQNSLGDGATDNLELSFNKEGTYTYTIRENSGTTGNVYTYALTPAEDEAAEGTGDENVEEDVEGTGEETVEGAGEGTGAGAGEETVEGAGTETGAGAGEETGDGTDEETVEGAGTETGAGAGEGNGTGTNPTGNSQNSQHNDVDPSPMESGTQQNPAPEDKSTGDAGQTENIPADQLSYQKKAPSFQQMSFSGNQPLQIQLVSLTDVQPNEIPDNEPDAGNSLPNPDETDIDLQNADTPPSTPEYQTGGIKYSDATYTLTVTVTDKGDGTLSATWTVTNSEGEQVASGSSNGTTINPATGEVAFTNTYHGATTHVNLKATKSLNGMNLAAGMFSFGVYNNEDCTGDTVTTGENDADGNVSFGSISYHEMDAENSPFTYYVKEIVPANGTGPSNLYGEYVYDQSVYKVEVTVSKSSENDTLSAVVTGLTKIKGADGTAIEEQVVSGMSFVNSYNPNEVSVPVTVQKTLNSEAGYKLTAGRFFFQLYRGTELTQENLIATVSNGAPAEGNNTATATFENLNFKKDQLGEDNSEVVFTYTIRERDDQNHGYTYDKSVYRLDITLSYNAENGKLTATPVLTQVKNATGGESNTIIESGIASFTNSYNPQKTVNITGTKLLNGSSVNGQQFEFEVTVTENGESTSTTVISDGSGSILIFSRNFTESGQVDLQVKEKIPSPVALGMTYDKSVYNVSIVVAKDETTGELLDPVVTITKNGESVDRIVFNNTYVPPTVTAYVNASKSLSNADIQDYSFRFKLVPTNVVTGDPVGSNGVTASNDASGNIQFALTYTNTGTYAYILSEEVGSYANITYDKSSYIVTVQVDATNDGRLSAKVTLPEGGCTFTNKYTRPHRPPQDPALDLSPYTGDEAFPGVWIGTLAVSLWALAGLAYSKRKFTSQK